MTCQICQGEGYVRRQGSKVPAVERCICQMKELMGNRLETGWRGLRSVPTWPDPSPLEALSTRDAWVTATYETMRQHVRRVAIRRGYLWNFQVITDSELMSSWLQNLVTSGGEIWDPDVVGLHTSYRSIAQIALPADLLIIRLGVKTARNAAMPEVLLEALMERQHQEKPTWVWDQPTMPLSEGHRCHSDGVMQHLRTFERVNLVQGALAAAPPPALTTAPSLALAPSAVPDLEDWVEPMSTARRDPFAQTSARKVRR